MIVIRGLIASPFLLLGGILGMMFFIGLAGYGLLCLGLSILEGEVVSYDLAGFFNRKPARKSR